MSDTKFEFIEEEFDEISDTSTPEFALEDEIENSNAAESISDPMASNDALDNVSTSKLNQEKIATQVKASVNPNTRQGIQLASFLKGVGVFLLIVFGAVIYVFRDQLLDLMPSPDTHVNQVVSEPVQNNAVPSLQAPEKEKNRLGKQNEIYGSTTNPALSDRADLSKVDGSKVNHVIVSPDDSNNVETLVESVDIFSINKGPERYNESPIIVDSTNRFEMRNGVQDKRILELEAQIAMMHLDLTRQKAATDSAMRASTEAASVVLQFRDTLKTMRATLGEIAKASKANRSTIEKLEESFVRIEKQSNTIRQITKSTTPVSPTQSDSVVPKVIAKKIEKTKVPSIKVLRTYEPVMVNERAGYVRNIVSDQRYVLEVGRLYDGVGRITSIDVAKQSIFGLSSNGEKWVIRK